MSVNTAADACVTLCQDPDEALVDIKLSPKPYTDSVDGNVFMIELINPGQGVSEVPLLKF